MLEPIAGVRALIPGPPVWITETRVDLRDAEGKVRCRLARITMRLDKAAGRHPPVRIRVEALRGYTADAKRIERRLANRFDWPRCRDDLVDAVYALQDTSAAPRAPAKANTLSSPVGLALRDILRQQLEVIEDRVPGVVEDIDSEFLHEMRVAIRRTRTALGQLKKLVPAHAQGAIRNGFAWLGTVTSPCRDLDVHLLDWKAHVRGTSTDDITALSPLGNHLTACKAIEHAALIKALRSRRYKTLIAEWRYLLDEDAAWRETEVMQRPIGAVLGKRIGKLHAQVIAEGRAIDPGTPVEALHELRKTTKKLRYVIEFVRDLHGRKTTKPVLRALKDLQEVLGEVQDREVQVEALQRFGHEMTDAGTATPDTLMAIGGWAEDLERRRVDARTRFADAFAGFDTAETRNRFHAIVAPKMENSR